MNNQLTFWVPGLRPGKYLASEPGEFKSQFLQQLPERERPQLQTINLLLSRADRVSATDVIKHDFLDDYSNEQLTGSTHPLASWPLAQWRLAIDDEMLKAESDYWLCADPVYIHPDRSQALLYAHEELDVQPEEAQALAELINEHYKDEAWQLHVGSSQRWYIKLDQQANLKTSTLQQAKGKNIFDYLPSGEDSRYWQQCMNEIQMLLHSSDVSQQREAQGKMPINSLWFWGHGLPVVQDKLPWQQIFSDDAVISGFALCGGSKIGNIPESINNLDTNSDATLIYYDKLKSLLQQQDFYGWLNELQALEDNWFAPLLEQVKKQGMELTVVLDDNEAYYLTARHLKRWWRRPHKNRLF